MDAQITLSLRDYEDLINKIKQQSAELALKERPEIKNYEQFISSVFGINGKRKILKTEGLLSSGKLNPIINEAAEKGEQFFILIFK